MTNRLLQIILVEDNPDDAELALRSFKQSNIGNDIVWIKDGEEAINFIFNGQSIGEKSFSKQSIILLDLNLPKINGVEILEKLKNDDDLKRIPVIVMTSSDLDADLKVCYDLGVNSYIVKPIDFKQFNDVTKTLGTYWLLLNKHPRE